MQGILATGSILCNPSLWDVQIFASCGSRSKSWLNQAHADKFLLASGSGSSRALTTGFRRGLGVYNALSSQLDSPHPSIDQDAYCLGRLSKDASRGSLQSLSQRCERNIYDGYVNGRSGKGFTKLFLKNRQSCLTFLRNCDRSMDPGTGT